jgi:hypothetical protein
VYGWVGVLDWDKCLLTSHTLLHTLYYAHCSMYGWVGVLDWDVQKREVLFIGTQFSAL